MLNRERGKLAFTSFLHSIIILNQIINASGTYQVSFGCNRYQNKIVTHAYFLTLRSLFWSRMHGPPTRLACKNVIENFSKLRYSIHASRTVKTSPVIQILGFNLSTTLSKFVCTRSGYLRIFTRKTYTVVKEKKTLNTIKIFIYRNDD